MEFIEEEYTDHSPSLMPKTAFDCAQVRLFISEFSSFPSYGYRLLRNRDPIKHDSLVQEFHEALIRVNSAFETQSDGPFFLGDMVSLVNKIKKKGKTIY